MADVSIAGGTEQPGAASAVPGIQRKNLSNSLAWFLAGPAMVLLLMAPDLWNGFPIIFPDTGGYLDRPILGTLGLGRSALYGLFLYAGIPFAF
jgi:hypothetical protein